MEHIETISKVQWTGAYLNDLPDSSFAYIESGGEKKDGKTEPRSLRHGPYKDMNGKVDLPHVRNLLARLNQIKGLSAEEETKIRARMEKLLGEKTEKSASFISKSIKSKHIVYACILDPYGNGTEGCQADREMDWTSPAEVEKTAHNFLKSNRIVKREHRGDPTTASFVESWIEPYPTEADYTAAMENKPHTVACRVFGDDLIHSGSWMAGVQLPPDLWNEYEQGNLNAFSIHGTGRRTKTTSAVFPPVTFVGAINE